MAKNWNRQETPVCCAGDQRGEIKLTGLNLLCRGKTKSKTPPQTDALKIFSSFQPRCTKNIIVKQKGMNARKKQFVVSALNIG